MKTCSKCTTPKDLSEFSFKNKAKGTHHSQCKPCMAGAKTAWYQRNRVEHSKNNRVRDKRYRAENEVHIIHYLEEHPCIGCGNDNILHLDFDHRNQSDKVESVAVLLANKCSWATIRKEIDKCNVLCANCHRVRTAAQCNSYKHRYVTAR